MIVKGRGPITTARRSRPIPTLGRGQSMRGSIIPMCWYCGSHTGEMNVQPDGTHLHDFCKEPAARDYPNRLDCDGEQVDAKVDWQDVRGADGDAGLFWA